MQSKQMQNTTGTSNSSISEKRKIYLAALFQKISLGESRLDSRILKSLLGKHYAKILKSHGFVHIENYSTKSHRAFSYGISPEYKKTLQAYSRKAGFHKNWDDRKKRAWIYQAFSGIGKIDFLQPTRRFIKKHLSVEYKAVKIRCHRLFFGVQNLPATERPAHLASIDQTATFATSLTRFASGIEKEELIELLESGTLYETIAHAAGTTRKEAKLSFNSALNRLSSWFDPTDTPVVVFQKLFPRLAFKFRSLLQKHGPRGEDGLFRTLFARDESRVWVKSLLQLNRMGIECFSVHDCIYCAPQDLPTVSAVVEKAAYQYWGFQPMMKIA